MTRLVTFLASSALAGAGALLTGLLAGCGGTEPGLEPDAGHGPDEPPPDQADYEALVDQYKGQCTYPGLQAGMTDGCGVAQFPKQTVSGSQFAIFCPCIPTKQGEYTIPSPPLGASWEVYEQLQQLVERQHCLFYCSWDALPIGEMAPVLGCGAMIRMTTQGYVLAAESVGDEAEECSVTEYPPYE